MVRIWNLLVMSHAARLRLAKRPTAATWRKLKVDMKALQE
jgi:hypothetical protein